MRWTVPRETRRLARIYAMEGLCSFAANILTISIFFYTRTRLNFTTRQNLIFSAAFGALYVLSALASHRVAVMVGVKLALAIIGVLTTLFALLPLLISGGTAVCLAVCGFVTVMTMSWPMFEHLVASGNISGETLSRRITIYSRGGGDDLGSNGDDRERDELEGETNFRLPIPNCRMKTST